MSYKKNLKQRAASFSLGEEEITAVVPIAGIVSGDLMLVGRKWDRRSNALRLGTVSGQTGLNTKIFLTAKGEFRNDVQPRVVDIVPEGLSVKIDPPSQIGGGDVVRIGIEIQIPPGAPPANNLCTETAKQGYILLETGHPKTPTLTIPVCVAIAE
jgi:predicted RecA/RadA family phage recombinase